MWWPCWIRLTQSAVDADFLKVSLKPVQWFTIYFAYRQTDTHSFTIQRDCVTDSHLKTMNSHSFWLCSLPVTLPYQLVHTARLSLWPTQLSNRWWNYVFILANGGTREWRSGVGSRVSPFCFPLRWREILLGL